MGQQGNTEKRIGQLEELNGRLERLNEELLKNYGRMSVSYLAMRVNRLEDELRGVISDVRKLVRANQERIDTASREFQGLRAEVKRLRTVMDSRDRMSNVGDKKASGVSTKQPVRALPSSGNGSA